MEKVESNLKKISRNFLTGIGILVVLWLIRSYGIKQSESYIKGLTLSNQEIPIATPTKIKSPDNTSTLLGTLNPPEKRSFYSSADYFGINFPATPAHSTLKALPTGQTGTTYDLSSYESKSGDKLFSVHRYTFSRQMIYPEKENTILDGFGQNMLNAERGNKLISSSFINFLSYSGLKLNYQSRDQYIWAMLLTVNKDLYLVMTQYPSAAGNYNEKEFIDFVNSFVITKGTD